MTFTRKLCKSQKLKLFSSIRCIKMITVCIHLEDVFLKMISISPWSNSSPNVEVGDLRDDCLSTKPCVAC